MMSNREGQKPPPEQLLLAVRGVYEAGENCGQRAIAPPGQEGQAAALKKDSILIAADGVVVQAPQIE